MLDTTVPLGEFLDEQLARVRENGITETDDIMILPLDMNCLVTSQIFNLKCYTLDHHCI